MAEAGAVSSSRDPISGRPIGTASWYMAAVLCSANTVAFIDRSSLPLLVQQIEHDLAISDTQMSLLIGVAFIIVYSGLGIPAGMLIDRFNRRRLLSAGVFLWSLSTVACGWATSYASLFAGRLGVGIGESICGPGAMSLVRDGFPAARRGRAVAVWAMGANIGAGTALLAGGLILAAIGDKADVALPFIGTIRSWQLVLICCGLIALPVAGLMFTFPEPGRAAPPPRGGSGLGDAARVIGSNWRLFLPLFVVNAATIMMSIGQSVWMPAILGRVWHVGRPEIGFRLGLMTLILGTSSQFLAGSLMDLLARRGVQNVFPLVGMCVGILVFVPAVYAPIAPSLEATWICLALSLMIGMSFFTIGTAAITRLAPSDMVGKVSSVHFLWVGVTGTAIGPTLIAAVSDLFFSGPRALGQSLSIVTACLDVVAILGFALVYRELRKKAPGIVAAAPASPAAGR